MSTRLDPAGSARVPRPSAATSKVAESKSRAEAELAEHFARVHAGLPGDEAVAAFRKERFAAFSQAGLPTRRMEAWHFTDLRSRMREAYAPAPSNGRQPVPVAAAADRLRLTLVDGVFRADLSAAALPAGLSVRPLADVLQSGPVGLVEAIKSPGLGEDPLIWLNAAMMSGGVVVDVAPGAQIEDPIELASVAGSEDARSVYARSLVRLGQGARATVVESDCGAGERQLNSVLVIDLGAGAILDHVWSSPRLAASGSSVCIASVLAGLAAGARLTSIGLVYDCAFLRRQSFVRFDGAGAEAAVFGLSLLRQSEHADNTLVVSHVAPHCKSRELFKHIVDEQGRGVFQGKIVVAPGSQKTDGVMASRALLLSDDAGMDNKPELEIFADDVVCGHGATCGELDRQQLFYAMARGLPRPDAEALLLDAFAQEILDSIGAEAVKESFAVETRSWLDRRGS